MGANDEDEATGDFEQELIAQGSPMPRVPRSPVIPTPTTGMMPQQPRKHAFTPRPLAEPDDFDDGDFEGDDPPTTAEPVRDDHHPQIVPRSPNIPTRPVPRFQSSDAFDDDEANPTMIDPHVPTGGAARQSFDPHARIDDNRRTADLSAPARRAMEPTSDLGPAARRAFQDNQMPRVDGRRNIDETEDLGPKARGELGPMARGTPSDRPKDVITTAPMGSGAIAAASRPRNPPSPTGPMLRPPPNAPPVVSSASGSQRAIRPGSSPESQRAIRPPSSPLSQRQSGSQPLLTPAPPPFVTDRRVERGHVELPNTIPDPPHDGLGPAPLRPYVPPAGPTMLERPMPRPFDPHGRIDDSSRTARWEPRQQEPFATPYAPTDQSHPPPPPTIKAISHKTPGNPEPPRVQQQRAIPQVQIRSMSDVSKKTPQHGMGRLAPPHDPKQARSRKTQDLVIWGSVIVITASIVTLVIWLIAR